MAQAEIEQHMRKLQTEVPSTAVIIEEVDKKIAQLAYTNTDTCLHLLGIDKPSDKRVFIMDNETNAQGALVEVFATPLKEASELQPEMVLPLPSVLNVQVPQLLTPFPLTVETPVLSPAFSCKDLLTQILDRVGTADSGELRVS